MYCFFDFRPKSGKTTFTNHSFGYEKDWEEVTFAHICSIKDYNNPMDSTTKKVLESYIMAKINLNGSYINNQSRIGMIRKLWYTVGEIRPLLFLFVPKNPPGGGQSSPQTLHENHKKVTYTSNIKKWTIASKSLNCFRILLSLKFQKKIGFWKKLLFRFRLGWHPKSPCGVLDSQNRAQKFTYQ